MILAESLIVPDNKEALLWDMDGVLLDSLSFDFELCNRLLATHLDEHAAVSRSTIRENFAYDLPEFWRRLTAGAVDSLDEQARNEAIERLVEAHEHQRRTVVCPVNEGIERILNAARQSGLKLAVVSNNPTAEVCEMLRKSAIIDFFDEVIGNDLENIQKKPSPDTYLLAAQRLKVQPADCVVIEDSILGAEAGRRAGCFTVAVATGADEFSTLEGSSFVDCAYLAFTENYSRFRVGDVTNKQISTANEFVSHMIEHIAWRMGCSVEVNWNNSDWLSLGRQLGATVAQFDRLQDSAAVLGMIDDGSAEVSIRAADRGELDLRSTSQVDLDWFLGLRCEQLETGRPLVEVMRGLAEGCSSRIEVNVCSLEDPHHTWEGVFRSLGIVLRRLYLPETPLPTDFHSESPLVVKPSDTGWTISGESVSRAEVIRETAETKVRVHVDSSGFSPVRSRFEVSDSIHVEGFTSLLDELSRAAGLGLEVDFLAKYISSSHVVMEDTGLVLGRALKEILVARMEELGVNGAGSSVQAIEDLESKAIRVGLSVEGRKFLYWVPFSVNHAALRRDFIIGHTVGEQLFSEDLDDFLDGFAGGLAASVVVHVKDCLPAEIGWPLLFRALGEAIREALEPNPNRKGVPPGVKASLA